MALSSDHIRGLIDLHCKNATLEAQLSQARQRAEELEHSNRYLLQMLCAPSAFPEPRDLSFKARPSIVRPDSNPVEEQKLVPHLTRQRSDIQAEEADLTRSDPNANQKSLQPQIVPPVVKTQVTIDVESDGGEDLPDRNDYKYISLIENPHAPRFVPGHHSSGFKRTVLINNLPASTYMKQLAGKITGGLVVSMRILDTLSITGSRSAVIVFFEENSALNFVQQCSRTPLRILDVEAEATLVPTPTAPVPARTYHNIIDYGATRCIIVNRCPVHLSLNHIRVKLSPREHPDLHGIIDMQEDSSGSVYIAFDSIDNASSARARINAYKAFEPAVAHFTPDPCATLCADLSSREAKPTMFTNVEMTPGGRTGFYPPRAPRATKGGPTAFGFPRPPRDLDAPRLASNIHGLDYEDVGPPPPKPMLRRAKPVDYSDLEPPAPARPLVNLIDDDPIPEPKEADKPADATTPLTPASGSSMESGQIQESIKESKHAPRIEQQQPMPFLPITNRHLGPAPAANIKATAETAETTLTPLESDPAKTGSASATATSSTSPADSVESERAKSRRHADGRLAGLQKKVEGIELNY